MTRRTSTRALARDLYCEMAAGKAANSQTKTPTTDPSTQEHAIGEKDLTARVRALYEDSAVPVREIAQIAGVSERTIYKYAAKHQWTPRYAWIDRGGVKRRRGWRAGNDVAPAKGAGGRFIRREDKDKPCAQGLKATDAAAAARAAAGCVEAERAARAAQAEAETEQRDEALVRAFGAMSLATRQLREHMAGHVPQGARPPGGLHERLAHMFCTSLELAIARCEHVVAGWAGARGDEAGRNNHSCHGRACPGHPV